MQGWARLDAAQRQRFFEAFLTAFGWSGAGPSRYMRSARSST